MSLTIWQLDPAQLTSYYDLMLCKVLADAGHSVRFITSHSLYDTEFPVFQNFKTDNVYFRGIGWPWLLRYPRLRRVLRALSYPVGHWQVLQQARRDKPDIIHIQWSRLPRLDYLLVKQLRALDIPIVHTVHDVVPLFDTRSKTDYLNLIYTSVDRLIVHAEANRTSLLEHYPSIDPQRVRIIPLIDHENIATPPGANQTQARDLLNLPQDATLLLFFGSIRFYKGLDVLARAFPEVLKAQPNVLLLVVGHPDSPTDTAPLETLRKLNNVTIRAEYVPYSQVWQYHLAADAVLFPYRHIYQSAALITAMGFGRAVIATQVGALPETVDGNGWIVPPEDPKALAQAMLQAVADPERLRRMGKRSLQLVNERHSGPVVAQALIQVYEDLLKIRTSTSLV